MKGGSDWRSGSQRAALLSACGLGLDPDHGTPSRAGEPPLTPRISENFMKMGMRLLRFWLGGDIGWGLLLVGAGRSSVAHKTQEISANLRALPH